MLQNPNLSGRKLNEYLLAAYGVSLYDLVYTAWMSGLRSGSPKFRTKALVSRHAKVSIERLSKRLKDHRYSRKTRLAYFKEKIEQLRRVPIVSHLLFLYKDPMNLEEAQRVTDSLLRFVTKSRGIPITERQKVHHLYIIWGGFFQPHLSRWTRFYLVKELIDWFYKKTGIKSFSIKVSTSYIENLKCRLGIKDYRYDSDRIETWRPDFFEKGNIYPVFIFNHSSFKAEWRVFTSESQPAIIFSDGEMITCAESGYLGLKNKPKKRLGCFE